MLPDQLLHIYETIVDDSLTSTNRHINSNGHACHYQCPKLIDGFQDKSISYLQKLLDFSDQYQVTHNIDNLSLPEIFSIKNTLVDECNKHYNEKLLNCQKTFMKHFDRVVGIGLPSDVYKVVFRYLEDSEEAQRRSLVLNTMNEIPKLIKFYKEHNKMGCCTTQALLSYSCIERIVIDCEDVMYDRVPIATIKPDFTCDHYYMMEDEHNPKEKICYYETLYFSCKRLRQILATFLICASTKQQLIKCYRNRQYRYLLIYGHLLGYISKEEYIYILGRYKDWYYSHVKTDTSCLDTTQLFLFYFGRLLKQINRTWTCNSPLGVLINN